MRWHRMIYRLSVGFCTKVFATSWRMNKKLIDKGICVTKFDRKPMKNKDVTDRSTLGPIKYMATMGVPSSNFVVAATRYGPDVAMDTFEWNAATNSATPVKLFISARSGLLPL